MLKKIFKQICNETWFVDIPKSPEPFPCGTEFKIVPADPDDPLADWKLMIKRPSDRTFLAPKVQLMKYVAELGGLVYLSVLHGKDKANLRRMTMSFDCRYPSNYRKSFFFEDTDVVLPAYKTSGTPKAGDADARGSGRPD